MNHISLFNVDETAAIPKYRQLINSVRLAIEQGIIGKGDQLPSVNQLCKKFALSRDTVLLAFNELKATGMVTSVPGKGYYIDRTDQNYDKQIFLLFDELNVFKEDLYTSFLEHLNSRINVDIYFHHFNFNVYRDLINNASGKYDAYIIMPAIFDHSIDIIKQLPPEKVYILDRLKPDLVDYPVIYQDFEQDVYDAMTVGRDLLRKYSKLIMVFPGGKEPEERVTGFLKFCLEQKMEGEIVRSLEKRPIQQGEAYFVVSDRNIVKIVKSAAEKSFQLGVDIGLVSFNDTMLKEVVGSGITTISTNFVQMGKDLANMVSQQRRFKLRNPSGLILRKSL